MKSFYLLRIDVEPGGARRDSHFVYRTLTEVQQALEIDLWQDFAFGLGMLYAYGENVTLYAYADGRKQQEINLLPFITVCGQNDITFTLDARANPIGAVRTQKEYRQFWTINDVNLCSEEFITSARATVDWAEVPVMPLEPPLLNVDEDAKRLYLEDDEDFDDSEEMEIETLPYGFCDHETGGENLDWVANTVELLAIDPDWLIFNNGTVQQLVETMHKTHQFDAMPVLADALQEAGCTNELFLAHCRAPAGVHAHGSWLVELLRNH